MDEPQWQRVGTKSEIAARKIRRTRLGAGHVVALHVFQDRVYAIGEVCPHRGATLANGCVGPDGYVECPEHGWEYALDTGRGREGWEGRVPCFDVVEREDGVYVAQSPRAEPG